jgi:hypothetical protein
MGFPCLPTPHTLGVLLDSNLMVIDWVWSSTRVSPLVRRLTTPKGRIGFNCLGRLFGDDSFASGCSPPCLTASPLPSATRSHVRFVLRFALVSLISITNARTVPALWRFGKNRRMDGSQSSLECHYGPPAPKSVEDNRNPRRCRALTRCPQQALLNSPESCATTHSDSEPGFRGFAASADRFG